MKNKIEKNKTLSKPPLQEVLFEIRWQMENSDYTNQTYDKFFDIAVGHLHSKAEKEFPVFKTKVPSFLLGKQDLLSYQTVYQYWTGENKWPVIQLGPGIFTVNNTDDNYNWKSNYLPLVKKGLKWLEESYLKKLNFNYLSLRYIDTISTKDYKFTDWCNFIEDNLNFKVSNLFNTHGSLKQFNFNQVFQMNNGSDLQIIISNAQNDKLEDILVWETAVINNKAINSNEIANWLETAHNITHNLFTEICKDELYNSFK